MKYSIVILIWIVVTVSCSAMRNKVSEEMKDENNKIGTMDLGAFSMSLSVKDLAVSKDFYEKLGFEKFGGDEKMNYLIMKNGETVIGLFHGMFEGNILTFNPGWDQNAKNVDPFMDVRKIQELLKSKGIQLDSETDGNTNGPANIIFKDPDGNMILLDQHR